MCVRNAILYIYDVFKVFIIDMIFAYVQSHVTFFFPLYNISNGGTVEFYEKKKSFYFNKRGINLIKMKTRE